MAYSTISTIRTATGFSDSNKISDATITAYLSDADSVIDSYIADIYTLPLSDIPEIIETIARNITVGLLYANEYGEESEDSDKGWEKRMNWWLSRLEAIQKQKIKLYDSNNNELTRSNLKKPLFKPTNSSSKADADDSDEQNLTMNQDF